MPGGQAHRRATLTLMVPAAAGGYALGGWLAASSALAGVAVTLVINPDLDLLENSIAAKLRRDWAPAWARRGLWRLFWLLLALPLIRVFWLTWYPYGRLFPHRSWGSHLPVVSTLIRLLYISLWLFLILAPLVYYDVVTTAVLVQLMSDLPLVGVGGVLAGWTASDVLHFIMDIASTRIRRVF
ncbi:MAG: DUF2227 family putative metal-binding protein [Candidatus Promineifilaceae bacterium]|nr:DUF2227 family putative metal-binding protein [Candidatus Promineifilaceae bacterium]